MADQDPISDRMTQVLKMIKDGHKNHEIAARLKISPKTVEKHRQKLNDYFRVDNPVSLIVAALRQGVISL